MIYPSFLSRILRLIASGIIAMSWPMALLIALSHAAITWIGLTLMGETSLLEGWVQFLYYYVVTASSVGYGDFSPVTDIGKLFCALWVRAVSLSSCEGLKRAGIERAAFIVILSDSNNESLAACLSVNAMGLDGHCVAYFKDRDSAALVKRSCPGTNVVTSTSIEQVTRALSDPGAGQVLHHLASTGVGATLASMRLTGCPHITVQHLTVEMRARFRATLIGYRPRGEEIPIMGLTETTVISEYDTVYYVAGARIPNTVVFGVPAPWI